MKLGLFFCTAGTVLGGKKKIVRELETETFTINEIVYFAIHAEAMDFWDAKVNETVVIFVDHKLW